MVGAALALAGFTTRERRATNPILDLRLLRNGAYTVGVTLVTLYFAALTRYSSSSRSCCS